MSLTAAPRAATTGPALSARPHAAASPHEATPGEPIRIRNLSRVFADGSGLHPADLDVHAGEFVSVLGPSGCGKSTLLRCVAGLETPDTGTIAFGETTVFDAEPGISVPTRRRGLGMVFQDLALWPHMNAHDNVAFPLSVARVPRSEIASRVAESLALVGLTPFADKMPHQLSGGQQQRVAIARAIVARPRVLLMDEPFSALDAALRLQLRDELRDLTTRLGLTTLYVTHDQAEAMAMSDRIAVLERGALRQVSTPETLYEQPANPFVAEFIGRCNWLPGRRGAVGVRPEHVTITNPGEATDTSDTPSIAVSGTIASCAYTGGSYSLTCHINDSDEVWSLDHAARISPASPVTLSVAEHRLMRIPASPDHPSPSVNP